MKNLVKHSLLIGNRNDSNYVFNNILIEGHVGSSAKLCSHFMNILNFNKSVFFVSRNQAYSMWNSDNSSWHPHSVPSARHYPKCFEELSLLDSAGKEVFSLSPAYRWGRARALPCPGSRGVPRFQPRWFDFLITQLCCTYHWWSNYNKRLTSVGTIWNWICK